MRKLVYIANARIPTEKAHGIQIFKTCEALVKAGATLELWVPKRYNPHIGHLDPFEFYSVKHKFPVVRLSSLDLIGWLDFISGLGFWIQAKTFAQKVAKKIRGLPPGAIVYSRDVIPLEPVRRAGLPYFYEAHTISNRPSEFQIKIWKEAKGIVTISNNLAQEFLKYVAQDKIIVAPDGVELEKFQIVKSKAQIREELGLPQDKQIVMYTGHLYDWKGARVLLEAARKTYQLPATSYKLTYVFVGGTDRDINKFKENAKGLENAVILDQKPHAEIPKYLAAADVLVLPNSGKYEISRRYTSPLKLFEYMAAGKPIVASDLPSIREILDETTAVFAKADDSRDLARKIELLLSDEKLQAQLAQEGQTIVKQYTWQSRAEKIFEFINSKL